ncbi:hypothetical protein BH10BAC3_BH10BAC3_24530 [soil metagenome]
MAFRFYKRIRSLLKRRINANKIGIKFTRSGRWNLPSKILINNEPVKLNLVNDHSTSNTFIDVFLDDCYGLLFFKQHLHSVNTVVDIGANQGLFVLFARNIFPAATIYAYEPNQSILPNLSYHAGIAKATYFNEAVGLTHGNITLHTGQDSLHGKTTLSDDGNIVQVSIRECLARTSGNVDLLKLDCEAQNGKY